MRMGISTTGISAAGISTMALVLALSPLSARAQAVPAGPTDSAQAEPATATTPADPAAAESGGFTDIVVTARRRSEPLQQTPLAVSAITAADIDAKHAVTIVDIGKSIPNVRIDSVGSQGRAGMLSIRGVNYARPDQTGDPSVAFYVDGLYQTRSTLNILDLFDIESVEVLRGPQGTLFGRNAFAGAVNIQSKRPSLDTFSGDIEARIANYGRREVRGAVNLPLVTDKLAVRGSLLYAKSNGFYNLLNQGGKSFGGDDNITGKVSFLFTPADTWNVFLKYEHVRDHGDPTPNKNASSPTQLFANLPGDPPNLNIGGRYDVSFNTPAGQKSFVNADNVVLNITKEIPDGSINLISGFQDSHDGLLTDPGSGNQPYLNSYYLTHVRAVSQEARFIREFAPWLQILAGAYYQRDEVDYGAITFSTYAPLAGANAEVRVKQNRDSWAVFAEAEIRPIDKVRINIAGRQMFEDKEFFFNRRVRNNATIAPGVFLPDPVYQQSKRDWQNFSPKISVDWRPTGDIMLYASWSKGFKSGGYAAISTSLANAGPYDPEKIETYEAGIKTFLFDRKVKLNVTGFWNNLTDLQRQVNFTINGITNNLVFNAASATTRGFEGELEVRPVSGLTFRAAAGYLDAYYKSFCAAFGLPGVACNDGANGGLGTPGAVDNSYLKLYNAPEWQFSGGATYRADLGDLGALTFVGDVSRTSSLFTTDNNAPISRRGAMTLVDASIQWQSADDRFSASLFALNLFNEIDVQQGISAGNTLSILNFSPPRRYGGSLGFHF